MGTGFQSRMLHFLYKYMEINQLTIYIINFIIFLEETGDFSILVYSLIGVNWTWFKARYDISHVF